jgi:hypothetical protein
LGIAVFARFFEKVVDLCQEAGLVWARELYFDATKVRANAAVDSLVPRFAVDARGHVAGLFADTSPTGEPPAISDPDRAPSDGLLRLPTRESTD